MDNVQMLEQWQQVIRMDIGGGTCSPLSANLWARVGDNVYF